MKSQNGPPREAAASSLLQIFGSEKAGIAEDRSIRLGNSGLHHQQTIAESFRFPRRG